MPDAPGSATAALERAYRETTYVVFVPGAAPIELHPGVHSAALDRLLARAGVRDWAFVSAWNPASRVLPVWRNAQRQRRLLTLLGAAPQVLLPGAGIPAFGDWRPEESLLVSSLPLGRALRLARVFGQHAILAGRRGRRAHLVWVRSCRHRPACA
jgi:hypothetical protein